MVCIANPGRLLRNFLMVVLLGPSSSLGEVGRDVQTSRLEAILEARDETLKARDRYRHPRETLAFFGITEGMHVAQMSPGSGWYTSIVVPLIGPNARIVGLYYNPGMWERMYDRYTPEMIAERNTHIHDFVPMVRSIKGGESMNAAAFQLGQVDESLHGTLDMVTMVRTLHNIMSVESRGGYLTEALSDVYSLLKPGGIAVVVQHRAPESADDVWANGRWGYVKTSAVVNAFEQAGFERLLEGANNPAGGDWRGSSWDAGK